MEGVDVPGIASPIHSSAVRANDKSCKLIDTPGGRMISGKPLRKEEGERLSAAHRNRFPHIKDVPLRICGIDVQTDRSWISRIHWSGDRRRRLSKTRYSQQQEANHKSEIVDHSHKVISRPSPR